MISQGQNQNWCVKHHPSICTRLFCSDEQYQHFLELPQLKLNAVLKGEELHVQRDFNANVGDDQHSSWPELVGKRYIGRARETGRLQRFCAINDLVVVNTVFQIANTRRAK